MTEAQLLVHENADALAADVAERLLSRLHEIQSGGRTPHVGLTGGTIADTVHAAIARVAEHSEVDWGNVVFWWGDERFVAPDSDDRNAVQARRALLDALVPLGLDPAHVHEVPSTADAASADEAAAAYADDLRAHGEGDLDVLMLGLGPDGHVASLFPGFPQLAVRDAVAVGVTGSPKPPPERVTLTFPTLNRSRAVWFLVSGEGKADALTAALRYGDDPAPDAAPAGPDAAPDPAQIAEIPARGVMGRKETLWFVDQDAATHL